MSEEFDYEKVLLWAKELSDKLPEKYQTIAFQCLVNNKINKTRNISSDSEGRKSSNTQEPSVILEQNRDEILPPAHVIKEKGSRKQQTLWVVIKLTQDGEEANIDSVQTHITSELGIKSQNRQNTGRSLRELFPRYLSRKPSGETKGYAYYPNNNSLEFFEGLQSE